MGEVTNSPEDIDSRLAKMEKKLNEEARPGIEEYIEKHGWKDAEMINRYVIQKGDSYLIQGLGEVQEIQVGDDNSSLSLKSTDYESWLEESEFDRELRRRMRPQSAISLSGSDVGSIKIGSMDVGSSGINLEGLNVNEIKRIREISLDVPGGVMKAKLSSEGIKFET